MWCVFGGLCAGGWGNLLVGDRRGFFVAVGEVCAVGCVLGVPIRSEPITCCQVCWWWGWGAGFLYGWLGFVWVGWGVWGMVCVVGFGPDGCAVRLTVDGDGVWLVLCGSCAWPGRRVVNGQHPQTQWERHHVFTPVPVEAAPVRRAARKAAAVTPRPRRARGAAP